MTSNSQIFITQMTPASGVLELKMNRIKTNVMVVSKLELTDYPNLKVVKDFVYLVSNISLSEKLCSCSV